MNANDKPKGIRHLLDDVDDFVSWLEISNQYFGRSASWMYQKMGGYASSGGFSLEEIERLQGALLDLADRFKAAASNLEQAKEPKA